MWPRSASLLLESPRSLAISSNMAFIIIAELKYHRTHPTGTVLFDGDILRSM
jgi:hypothetical protein